MLSDVSEYYAVKTEKTNKQTKTSGILEYSNK